MSLFRSGLALATLAAGLFVSAPAAWSAPRSLMFRGASPRIVTGESATLPGGAAAVSWARVSGNDRVSEVGVDITLDAIRNPVGPGSGPAGAVAVLSFPPIAQETTFFNHFEMHWEEHGHPPIYWNPHFDFHFYGVPESTVWGIVPPDSRAPDASQVPEGYIYPGVGEAVPQMGVHAAALSDFTHPFNASMILGYWGGRMIFIEPMITREYLLTHPNFAMTIPRPRYLYRDTIYPTVFRSQYNPRTRTYRLSFQGFSPISAPREG